VHAASFHTCKVARVLAAEKGELRSKTITNDGARLEMSDSLASDVGPNFMARQPGAQQVRASGLSAGTAAQRVPKSGIANRAGAVNSTAPARLYCGGSLDTANPLAKRGVLRERAAIEAPDCRLTHLQDL
jgi:hypothetical protein